MSVRAIDFSSSAYAKTKSFKAKENAASTSKIKEKRTSENQPSSVKSSWTPLKQDLNEKVCISSGVIAFFFRATITSYKICFMLQLFDERKELVSNWVSVRCCRYEYLGSI